jgi:hypothetical protein
MPIASYRPESIFTMSPMAVEKLSSLFLVPVSLGTSGSNHKRKSLRDPIKSSSMTREDADGQLMQRVFIRSTLWAMTSSPCSNTWVCHMRM